MTDEIDGYEYERFDPYYGPDPDLPCHTCGGDGYVDSVAEASGRWDWDTEQAGPCPNCGGSGLRKDCKTF